MFKKTVSSAVSFSTESTDSLVCRPDRFYGCSCLAAEVGNGTPAPQKSLKSTTVRKPLATTTNKVKASNVKASKAKGPIEHPAPTIWLVSLEEARASDEIRLRGIDPAPIRLPFVTADFRNFNLISLADAQSTDEIRLRTVMM